MNILLKNGHIVDPATGRDEISDILIAQGVIERIKGTIAVRPTTEVFDLKGKVIAPGFIDMHVHAREPGSEHKETIATAMAAAAAGGFTAICCMPNTDPPIDEASVVDFIRKKAAEAGPVVDVYVAGAVTKGRKGKELAAMGELAEAGAVAFSDDGSPVENAEIMRRALEYAGMLNKPIIQHAEERSMTAGGAMNEGTVSTRLGISGMPSVAEDIMVARDVELVQYLSVGRVAKSVVPRYHVAHISTAGAIEIVRRAKKVGLAVTCEAAPHHFSLTHEAVRSFDTNTKMSPPLRTREDVEAVKEGLRDGTIDVIATDHAPHTVDEKQVEYASAPFGIVGLETALGLAITALVGSKVLTVSQLVEKFSTNPRRILQLPQIQIAEGQRANLTIFDPAAEWTVAVDTFKSKSKNSPFEGWRLKGKAVGTINNEVVRLL